MSVPNNELDLRLHRLALAQEGVVSYDQARALGFTRSQIGHRRRSGRWSATAMRAVVRLPGVPVTWESQLMAARLAVGRSAVVSHRSAARLLGLDGFEREDKIEFVQLRGGRGRRSGIELHTTRRLPAIDQAIIRRSVAEDVRRSTRGLGLVVAYDITSADANDPRSRLDR